MMAVVSMPKSYFKDAVSRHAAAIASDPIFCFKDAVSRRAKRLPLVPRFHQKFFPVARREA
jgi:hypothetical protein